MIQMKRNGKHQLVVQLVLSDGQLFALLNALEEHALSGSLPAQDLRDELVLACEAVNLDEACFCV